MSEVKVNKISPRTNCGTTTLGDSGDTFNIPCGSKINVASGGSIVVASGATITNNGTQTGFGREGSVDWQTSSIKTATFTAANGEGYFCNTTSGGFTVNLPAGSAGAIVAVSDYSRTFQTNNLTITPNGSEKIGGATGSAILTTEGQSATFVYVDATEGWINVQETSNSIVPRNFLTATGGNTVTTCGNFKIHTFTSPGTFCVSQISSCAAENTVGYMVVAGGGGGGGEYGGGGGAGGFREGRNVPIDNFTASPLVANAPTNAITVTATGFPITVGGGGAGGSSPPVSSNGNNSVFSTIISAGGGAGRYENPAPSVGSGGSGGGGGGGGCGAAGSGNTPPVSPSQGNNGGGGPQGAPHYGRAGGGGAGAVGQSGNTTSGGNGGAGVASSITGSPVTRAGGGGGGVFNAPAPGGAGGGGSGGGGAGSNGSPAGGNGTANTGSGGGGGSHDGNPGCGGTGGSGIVIIRYKYQ